MLPAPVRNTRANEARALKEPWKKAAASELLAEREKGVDREPGKESLRYEREGCGDRDSFELFHGCIDLLGGCPHEKDGSQYETGG